MTRAGLSLTVLLLLAGAFAAALAVGWQPAVWNEMIAWVYAQQRLFHRELTGALSALTQGGGAAAAWALILASFVYGVFHAAGPGHGKAVLTAYLVTHPANVKRGVWLAVASALCQGVVAVVLVYGLIFLAGWLPRQTTTAVSWSERASFVLVFLIGAFLTWRGGRSVWRRLRAPGDADAPGHDASHDHGTHCGHSHGPDAAAMSRATDLRTSLGVILSIGLRPCTGAVLVLVFAKIAGMIWAGVAAVAAISIGTGIAVATLAVIAVNARSWAVRLSAGGGRGWALSSSLAAFAGGLFITAVGVSLLAASFAPRHPLGL